MSEEEIIEGNKEIAAFMGYEVFAKHCVRISDNTTTTIELWAKYHTSWDWLMPVVEKIELEQGCIIEMWLSLGKGCKINRLASKHNGGIKTFAVESNSFIESVWQAVVEFIRWHNENKEA